MSASVICSGCGQRVDVPADYRRRKMRCPVCGVMCEVPDPAGATGPAARPGRRPAAPPGPDPEAAAEEVLLPSPPARTCSRCGAILPARGTGECPACAPPARVRRAAERPARPAAAPPPARPREDSPEGSDAYGVVGGLDEPKCPGCARPLPADAVVCPECGFNRTTGKKPPRVYEPVERHWVAGLPLPTRLVLFIAFEAVILPLGLASAILIDEVPGFIFCWLLGTAMAAFLLGTFDRVDVARTKRGRVTLTRTWRVCFLPRPAETIRVSEYEGIVTCRTRDVAFWDWFVLFMLLPVGFIPAVVWFFYTINRDSYQVALAKDHGYPETVLYRGWSEEHMRALARGLSDVTELPWDGG